MSSKGKLGTLIRMEREIIENIDEHIQVLKERRKRSVESLRKMEEELAAL
jgi:hypothetical protein